MRSVLVIAASAAAVLFASAAPAAPLTLHLTGLRAGGKLYVQVQTREQFLGPNRAVGQVIDAPAAGERKLTFDLPPGDYAASVWHDDNGNGVYDLDPATRAPLDGWAATNGDALTGPPTFDDVRVTLPATGAKAVLRLHYGR